MNTDAKFELIGAILGITLFIAACCWEGYCTLRGTPILEAKCKETQGWIERDYAKHRFVKTPSGRAIYMNIYGKECAPGDPIFFFIGID